MSEFDKLVEGFLKPRQTLDFNGLIDLVEEVLEIESNRLVEKVKGKVTLTEKASPSPAAKTFTISMIPDIEVSELGWSDVRTPEEGGAVVKSRERQLLESYLQNILGSESVRNLDSLPEQLNRLSSFYDNPRAFVEKAPNRAQRIQQAVSLLVFYKTLTKIIANFNASSAGFSFESFLATLLDGVQVPANTGTIADFYAGGTDGVPVSLKLYNEKSVEVGGSFADLVGDLLNDSKNNTMTYLVVMKNLKGDMESLTGNLTFYQFDFTLDNVFDIIEDTKASSQQCIILPLGDEDALPDVEVPDRVRMTPQALSDMFTDNMRQALGNEELVGLVMSSPYFQYGTDEMLSISGKAEGPKFYLSRKANKENMDQLLRGIPGMEEKYAQGFPEIVDAIIGASRKMVSDIATLKAQRKSQVSQIVPGMKQYRMKKGSKGEERSAAATLIGDAAKRSQEYYNGLKGDREAKKAALKKTNGYLNEMQFSVNRSEVFKLAQPMAKLEVGAAAIQKMLNEVTKDLNTEVFGIFQALESLSDNLNGFFASGLADDEKATNAISNAQDIETKTEKAKSN